MDVEIATKVCNAALGCTGIVCGTLFLCYFLKLTFDYLKNEQQ